MAFSFIKNLKYAKPPIPAYTQTIQNLDADALSKFVQVDSRPDDLDLLVKLTGVELVPATAGFLHLLDGVDEVIVAFEHGA